MKFGKPHYGTVNLEGRSFPKTEALIIAAAQEMIQCAAEEDVNAFFTTENGVKLDICIPLADSVGDVGPAWSVDLKEIFDFQISSLSKSEIDAIAAYFHGLAKHMATRASQTEGETQ